MKAFYLTLFGLTSVSLGWISGNFNTHKNAYKNLYFKRLDSFEQSLKTVIYAAEKEGNNGNKALVLQKIHECRYKLKELDFWLRYFEPVAYKKINGPLQVEWETEVFENYEKPYKRNGAGLTLAENYILENDYRSDSFISILWPALKVLNTFRADSVTRLLDIEENFYFASRLYALNLASIYTTGFECPDTNQVIPELKAMITSNIEIINSYRISAIHKNNLADTLLTQQLNQWLQLQAYLKNANNSFTYFNRFEWITRVNKSYLINSESIISGGFKSKNYNDYCLNTNLADMWDKKLFNAQNIEGYFSGIKEEKKREAIKEIGKLLFYDPILSGNNMRSCASCHKSSEYFTDTTKSTALQFNQNYRLVRNTPSLINVSFNHLLMADGGQTSLQNQAVFVITNPIEMNGNEKTIISKIMSVPRYKKAFQKFVQWVPGQPKFSIYHIASAITMYSGSFNSGKSYFGGLLNNLEENLSNDNIVTGFNLFMGKAQCGTCHFFPIFSGAKPPYISSEFEVLGTPVDTIYSKPSSDLGRYNIHNVSETYQAFRTPSLLNVVRTAPYMHNGVFSNLKQVLDFYDNGGGNGHGFNIKNQTLPADSLHLTNAEKQSIILFLTALNETNLGIPPPPLNLPKSKNPILNKRKVGGEY
jgi:cytochrome c peroxidase